MHIVLINSIAGRKDDFNADTYIAPLGLLYIASYLIHRGHDVTFIDPLPMGINNKELKILFKKRRVDLIGINAVTASIKRAAEIGLIAKTACKAQIILGGPHVSALPLETLTQYPTFDFACIGEGEITMAEICQDYPQKKARLQQINGLAFRNGGDIVLTEKRDFLDNLDFLPYPARDLCDIHRYGSVFSSFYAKDTSATMLTSRGCINQCTYCVSKYTMGSKFRTATPRYVIDEIALIHKKYNIKAITFIDNAFTIDINRATSICKMMIEEKLNISWACETRIDFVTKDLLELMHQAGCKLIYFGVESGSPVILKNTNRRITLEQAKKAIAIANSIGIKTVAGFLIGNTDETEKTIKETINFAVKAKPFLATFGIVISLPGTKSFQDIIKAKDLMNLNWDDFNYKGFSLFKKFPELCSQISTRKLKKLLFLAYARFYSQPHVIMRIIKETTCWRNFFSKVIRFVYEIPKLLFA